MERRKKRDSSKINLTLSAIFHAIVVLALIYFAARQGILGKRLKEITVTMAPKEKKPEPPKAKPPEPKVEPPKQLPQPKMAATAPPPPVQTATAPPPVAAEPPPTVAPAPVVLPDMDFQDGAKVVQSAADPNAVYKALVEHALRSRWTRPDDIDDSTFVAEVELHIDADGNVSSPRWLKKSGNSRWDKSVKEAVAATPVLSRPPPKGFPPLFIARFDVESERTEDVIHFTSR